MVTAYLGLGSNVGNRVRMIHRAISTLGDISGLRVTKSSPLYLTSPVGPCQRSFVNAVVQVRTMLSPESLLRSIKSCERQLGRIPSTQRWGPREIDIDILVFGKNRVRSRALVIPHKELIHRLFVLEPLVALTPKLIHPVEHKTMRRLRDELREKDHIQKVVRWKK